MSDGGIYNHAVTPVYSAADIQLDTATVFATLNAAPFTSNSLVSAEGQYTLIAYAANTSGITSTQSAHFEIDTTSPTITILGLAEGSLYKTAVTPVVSALDLHLSTVNITLDGMPFASGTSISTNGQHLLVVTALDAAGNSTVRSTNFKLCLPPAAPAEFTMKVRGTSGAEFSWQSNDSNITGYRVYKNSILLSQGLVSATQFADIDYIEGTAAIYEVSSIDSYGQEGAHAVIPMPAVAMAVSSFGTKVNGTQELSRGYFDSVNLKITNAGTVPVMAGPVRVKLISGGVIISSAVAASVNVDAGGYAFTTAYLPVPETTVDAPTIAAAIEVYSDSSSIATLIHSVGASAYTPSDKPAEFFYAPLVRGIADKITVKLNNPGSAPYEAIVGAQSEGRLDLYTTNGTLLASSILAQTDNGAQQVLGSTAYYVEIPAGGSFVPNAVMLPIPSATGQTASLVFKQSRICSGLRTSSPQCLSSGLQFSKTLPVTSTTSYSVSVRPSSGTYDQGSIVSLSGFAHSVDGTLLPGATVEVGIAVHGYERTVSTFTDSAGAYSVAFTPAADEAGLYSIWASNDAVLDKTQQSTFTIVGFALQYSQYNVKLVQNSGGTFGVSLVNSGQETLQGLALDITGQAAGASVDYDTSAFAATLGAGQSANITFTAHASSSAVVGVSTFTVRVTDSNGFARSMPVYLSVGNGTPVPVISPQLISVGVTAGQVRTVSVTLSNNGYAAWKNVVAQAPTLDWVTIAGANSFGDIEPGATAVLTLSIAPASALATQTYNANPLVVLRSDNAGLLNILGSITVTSFTNGSVVYSAINADKVRDSAGNGVPVSSASITIISLDAAGITYTKHGDANGVVRFDDIPAGRYNRAVTASGFGDVSGVDIVEPGISRNVEVPMPTTVATYEWVVSTTTISDEYGVTLAVTYRTDVLAPVVVLSPNMLQFNLKSGETADSQITVTNKGLISARNVKIAFNDSSLSFTMPYDSIAELKPGDSVILPLRVKLK